jgi:hypothetical protein
MAAPDGSISSAATTATHASRVRRASVEVLPRDLRTRTRRRVSTGIPVFIGENGTVEQYDWENTCGDPNVKTQWFSNQCATRRSWPEVKTVLYSHTTCTHKRLSDGVSRRQLGAVARRAHRVRAGPCFLAAAV